MLSVVKVTDKCIKYGRRCRVDNCAVARALQRSLNDPTAYCNRTHFALKDGKVVLPLPQIAIEFIAKFDAKLPVEPFEFEVDL